MPSLSGDSIAIKGRYNNLCHRFQIALPLVFSTLLTEIISICGVKVKDQVLVVLYSKSKRIADQNSLNEIVEQYAVEISNKPIPRSPLLVDVMVEAATVVESKVDESKTTSDLSDDANLHHDLLPHKDSRTSQTPHSLHVPTVLSPKHNAHAQSSVPATFASVVNEMVAMLGDMNKRMDNIEGMLDHISKKLDARAKAKRVRKASKLRARSAEGSAECSPTPIQPDENDSAIIVTQCATSDAPHQHESMCYISSLQASIISHVDIDEPELSISALLLAGSASTSSSGGLTNTSVLSDSSAHRLMSHSGQLDIQLLNGERLQIENNVEEDLDQGKTSKNASSEMCEFPEQGSSAIISPSRYFQDSILQSSLELENTETSMSESDRFDYVEVSHNDSRLSFSDSKEAEDDGYIALLGSSSSQSFNVDPQYEASIQMLRDSGYQNLKMNLALLKEYDGDLTAVTKALEDYAEYVEF